MFDSPRPRRVGAATRGPSRSHAAKSGAAELLFLGLTLGTVAGSPGCSEPGGRSTPRDAGRVHPRADASDARHDAALRDASGISTEPTAVSTYARASATLLRVATGPTVVAGQVESADVDAATALWPIHGVATLRTTTEGVDLTVSMQDCRSGHLYPVVLFEGADCAALTRDSATWDDTRGKGIAPAICPGAPGAFAYYARKSDEPKPWSLGGSASSNVLGHAIAVLDPDTGEPLACGVIAESSDGGLARFDHQVPRPEVVAQLTGVCMLEQLGLSGTRPDGTACPDLAATGACAITHCYQPACEEVCASHVACLDTANEPCSTDCQPSDECTACVGDFRCVMGFCESFIGCATITPGGPCTELEACCLRQGPQTEACLVQARQLQVLGGDATCLGLLNDFDFNTSVTHRSQCYQEGFGEPD